MTDRDKPPLDVWWEPWKDVVSGARENSDHDWQQALGEAAHFVGSLSPVHGFVVDPMCGSGTTLLAAKGLGRRFLGMDIDRAALASAAKNVLALMPEEVVTP